MAGIVTANNSTSYRLSGIVASSPPLILYQPYVLFYAKSLQRPTRTSRSILTSELSGERLSQSVCSIMNATSLSLLPSRSSSNTIPRPNFSFAVVNSLLAAVLHIYPQGQIDTVVSRASVRVNSTRLTQWEHDAIVRAKIMTFAG
jgi:hypothetical protein